MLIPTKLWGYLLIAGGFIISTISFGAYNQSIAKGKEQLKQAKKENEALRKDKERHVKNTEIEESVARMSADDVNAGLQQYYRDDSDV